MLKINIELFFITTQLQLPPAKLITQMWTAQVITWTLWSSQIRHIIISNSIQAGLKIMTQLRGNSQFLCQRRQCIQTRGESNMTTSSSGQAPIPEDLKWTAGISLAFPMARAAGKSLRKDWNISMIKWTRWLPRPTRCFTDPPISTTVLYSWKSKWQLCNTTLKW